MSLECTDQNTNEEDAETSDLLCKHMHMKNNSIINTKVHAYQLKLSNVRSEMSIQEVKICASFGNTFSLPILLILALGQDPLVSLFDSQGTLLASFFDVQPLPV